MKCREYSELFMNGLLSFSYFPNRNLIFKSIMLGNNKANVLKYPIKLIMIKTKKLLKELIGLL